MQTHTSARCSRREFLAGLGASATVAALAPGVLASQSPGCRTNVLLITVDDMNFDSTGVTGSKAPDITPNIDALAGQGIRFEQAHVTSSICQPCRSVLMTGRYPHRNGALGFEPINVDVPTLGESTRTAGYHNGILAKPKHLAPESKFCWDTIVDGPQLAAGRDPKLFYKHAKSFFEEAKSADKPFFLMANSEDPHRPFPEPDGERPGFPNASRHYKPDEVETPPILPQGIPDIQREVAQYCTAVHRCDETVGELLRALKESGLEENTMVIFLSDNGMAFPYAKTNCYFASTATPLIIRWPGKIKAGTVNSDDLVSAIDIMPTVLEAAGIEPPQGMDGRSLLPLLSGRKQDGRDKVFTFITRTAGRRFYPMRCIRTKHHSYIYNSWSDGETVFINESQGGLTFRVMQAVAEHDKKVAERVRFFQYRVREELYDMDADPNEFNNLVDSPEHKPRLEKMRADLLEMMVSTDDPLLDTFKKQVLGAE